MQINFFLRQLHYKYYFYGKIISLKVFIHFSRKDWFYLSYLEYIVIYWMPESKKPIRDKSVKRTNLKNISDWGNMSIKNSNNGNRLKHITYIKTHEFLKILQKESH